MSVSRVVLERVLTWGGCRGAKHGLKIHSNVWQPQRLEFIPSKRNIRWNSATAQQKDSAFPSPPVAVPIRYDCI